MDKSILNTMETQTSLNNNFSDAVQAICLSMVPRQRGSKSIIKLEESNRPSLSVPPSQYGYLEHIQTFKPLCKLNDKSLPRKVR